MLFASVRFAFRSLHAQRLRCALTILGIIIGVAAVVVMVAIGSGARDRVAAQIRSLGANLISINAGSALMRSVRLGSGAAPWLSEDDALAIEREIPGAVAVAPLLYAKAQVTVGASNWASNIRGVAPEYFSVREWDVTAGRELTRDDTDRAAKVVLLGATMRDKLFGAVDPIDATIRIRDVPFTVIGLLDRKGQSVWGDDQDDVALVPLTTARRQFIGVSRANPRLVHNISVKFAEGASAHQIMLAIQDLLRQRHRLQDERDDSFVVSDLAEAANVERATTRLLSVLLAALAAVSLVVGGIGIMNIMLVTVTERTREIGLRLAVGARQRDILAQFLVEAVALAILGAVLGVVTGAGGSLIIAIIVGWPVVIDSSAVLLAVAFATAVGVFFGFYPAYKAARMNPIIALRFE